MQTKCLILHLRKTGEISTFKITPLPEDVSETRVSGAVYCVHASEASKLLRCKFSQDCRLYTVSPDDQPHWLSVEIYKLTIKFILKRERLRIFLSPLENDRVKVEQS